MVALSSDSHPIQLLAFTQASSLNREHYHALKRSTADPNDLYYRDRILHLTPIQSAAAREPDQPIDKASPKA